LTEELVKTIQSAAAAAKTAAALGKLKLTKIAVNIQFGVKWDVSGGINAPISLVTVGINGDKNKNTVQSVTLTFGK
jgi:polyisoprenoid-binding protein YceI